MAYPIASVGSGRLLGPAATRAYYETEEKGEAAFTGHEANVSDVVQPERVSERRS